MGCNPYERIVEKGCKPDGGVRTVKQGCKPCGVLLTAKQGCTPRSYVCTAKQGRSPSIIESAHMTIKLECNSNTLMVLKIQDVDGEWAVLLAFCYDYVEVFCVNKGLP